MTRLFTARQTSAKLLITGIFLLLLILLYQAWSNWWTLLAFVAAYCAGVGLLFLDEHYLYQFYQDKIDKPTNNDTHFPELISRNTLFLLSLPFLSIFVFTSSGSLPGIALVLALNCYLLIELWQLRPEYLLFKDRFLQMMQIQASRQLVDRICMVATAYFFILLGVLIL